eukprot:531300-Rhodomonas_salina.1
MTCRARPGDAAELKRKKEEWNRDWLAPSSDEQSDENNIEPTNDPAWMQVTDPASGKPVTTCCAT